MKAAIHFASWEPQIPRWGKLIDFKLEINRTGASRFETNESLIGIQLTSKSKRKANYFLSVVHLRLCSLSPTQKIGN